MGEPRPSWSATPGVKIMAPVPGVAAIRVTAPMSASIGAPQVVRLSPAFAAGTSHFERSAKLSVTKHGGSEAVSTTFVPLFFLGEGSRKAKSVELFLGSAVRTLVKLWTPVTGNRSAGVP